MDFPPVYAHGPVARIGDDLFWVHGSIKFNALMTISRNMAIVKSGGDLTLINPVRLNEAGLAALDALGAVKHIVRLGAAHGLDEPFYVARHKPLVWRQEGRSRYPAPPIDRVLSEGGPLPFGGARLVSFGGANFAECAIALARGKGVLLTCDSLQHYGDYSNNNLIARVAMPLVGFPRTTLVGPIWLRHATPTGGSLRADFERLLALDFDALLSAHGTFLASGAHAAAKLAVDKAIPR